MDRQDNLIELNDHKYYRENRLGLWIARFFSVFILAGFLAIVFTCTWKAINAG